MKKVATIICAMLCVFSLAACAQNKKKTTMNSSNNKQKKVLVAYFSATGITRSAAGRLAKAMGGTLHEIKPQKAYTSADLDWNNAKSRSTVEMKNPKSRPAITGKLANMADYDVVFIGFPIWWYTAPTIINTFIESYNLRGKTLVPFATSGGSTIDKSCKDLKNAYPSLSWKQGKLLNSVSDRELAEWKKSLGI